MASKAIVCDQLKSLDHDRGFATFQAVDVLKLKVKDLLVLRQLLRGDVWSELMEKKRSKPRILSICLLKAGTHASLGDSSNALQYKVAIQVFSHSTR